MSLPYQLHYQDCDLPLVSKNTVKCDGPFSTNLNIQHGSSTIADMIKRSLQLCWPTLWKLRWGLELSALVLSSLHDTLHCHLLQAREGMRKTLRQQRGSIHLRVDIDIDISLGQGYVLESPLTTFMSNS